jgi:hypothetical protein
MEYCRWDNSLIELDSQTVLDEIFKLVNWARKPSYDQVIRRF